jgi:hypothetical protein
MQLDPRAIDKVSGNSWNSLRPLFLEVGNRLLAVSPDAVSELTTIYVKFCTSSSKTSVFAVVWLKSSKELIIGLALPDVVTSPLLGPAPPKTVYRGLTKYFTLQPGDSIPTYFDSWVQSAFEEVSRNQAQTRD